MAQPPLQLVIGNYNTSSWSLRAWLAMRLARLAFTEIRVPLRRADTPAAIRRYSPSGKLPVLLVDGMPVWDSLSIAELIAELDPAVWPADAARRAEARSISAEMHGGFADLRRLMPMDLVSRFGAGGRMPRGLTGDIARISTIWRSCRDRHAAEGPFLFGSFTLADAMMAPVASRFVTHAVPLDPVLDDYVDSVMSWPDMVTWRDAAAAEVEELEKQGALEVKSVARAGRAAFDEPPERPQPLVVPMAEPGPTVERSTVDDGDEAADAVPEAPADAAPAVAVEPPAMRESEPVAEAETGPLGGEEREEKAVVAAAPPSPPVEPPPPPQPTEPVTEEIAQELSHPLPARSPVADLPLRPLPEPTPEGGGQNEAPRRPGATTIKPIGSGILRRR